MGSMVVLQHLLSRLNIPPEHAVTPQAWVEQANTLPSEALPNTRRLSPSWLRSL